MRAYFECVPLTVDGFEFSFKEDDADLQVASVCMAKASQPERHALCRGDAQGNPNSEVGCGALARGAIARLGSRGH